MSYHYKYPRLALTVDIIVFLKEKEEVKILLIQRGRYPFEGKWALPGGFVDMDETIENTAIRELKEETGLSKVELKQFHAFSAIGRDPRGRTVSVVFYGFTDSDNCKIKGDDDARDAKWFSINNIPELAFDHNEIIEMALNKFISNH